ncbi:histidine phosphatase family protein [Ornithinimicrobium sufpigmenti]|uniref:histidine phosphatase family protein n=1 Tax=Ornithinimicrobium sufpigmenti TaxID=2508882 RepID=UPI0010366BB4|nr:MULTISPECIES: histidine phosphatase family protein [unclassified Ornithinimicrobium]
MRRVIVWRHGETEQNAAGVYQGHLDSALSVRGREQAAQAAAALTQRSPARLVSSDLARAAGTADALAEVSGLPVETDARWREIDVGQWQGMRHADVVALHPQVMDALDRGEDVRRGGDGETVADLQRRARAAFDDLVATQQEGETVVVSTHGLASRALVADVVGLSYRQAWLSLVGLRNAHWAELVEHRTGWRLEVWNAGVGPSVGSVTDR